MKISKRQLAKIIRENLLLEAPSPLAAEVVFQQLLRGDAAFQGQRLAGSTTTFIRSCVSRGIVGSTGTVYRGGDAVAYLVHRILPRVYASNLGSASSATAVKNSLRVIKMFANEYNITAQLRLYRVVDGPNYIAKLLNTNMGRQILNMMPDAAKATKTAVQAAESAGALTKPAAQVTNAIARTTSAAGGGVRTAQQAARAIIKVPEAASLVRQAAAGVVNGGQSLARVPQGNQLVTTAANAVTSSSVPEVAANSGKLAKFLKFLGPVGLAMLVLDTFYAPVALFADGELVIPGTGIKIKVGIGVNDMDTPWGQLTYRRKRLGNPPAKPSDFNDEYKNVIATLIWNQRKEGEEGQYAREWTRKAISEDLIDREAWKAYLAPWREAEAKIKEAEKLLAEEGEADTGSEDVSPIGDIDEDALADLGEDTGENLSDNEEQTRGGSEDDESGAGSSSTSGNSKVSKVQRLIGMRPDGEWSRDVNIKLGAFAVAESFSEDKKVKTTPANLEWWKDWKNSAPKIKKITVGSRNMTFGTGGNPPLKANLDSLIKVLEFIKDSRESMNENFSRGTLLRRRYRKLY